VRGGLRRAGAVRGRRVRVPPGRGWGFVRALAALRHALPPGSRPPDGRGRCGVPHVTAPRGARGGAGDAARHAAVPAALGPGEGPPPALPAASPRYAAARSIPAHSVPSWPVSAQPPGQVVHLSLNDTSGFGVTVHLVAQVRAALYVCCAASAGAQMLRSKSPAAGLLRAATPERSPPPSRRPSRRRRGAAKRWP
jgi:hypothetical protein